MIAPPSELGVEEVVVNAVLWLQLLIEAIGALVIGVGMILAGLRFTRGSFPPQVQDFNEVRFTLARLFGHCPGVPARYRHPVDRSGAELGGDRQARSDCRHPDGAQLFPEQGNA